MIALAIAAAAAMIGPRHDAFADRCAELKQDDAALVCNRLKKASTGGHAVEIWQTSSRFNGGGGEEAFETITIYVAMRDAAGWYVSDPVAGFQTFHENGHHNAGGTSALDHLVTGALEVGGNPAIRVRAIEDWTGFCTPCDVGSQQTRGVTIEQATCVIDPAGPRCFVLDKDAATTVAIASSVAVSGPTTTAFAARCAALRADTPDLECKLVKTLRGDHPVQVWATTTPPQPGADTGGTQTSQVFVAIQANAGWYLSDAVVTTETDSQPTPPSTAAVSDRIDAKAVRVGGHRAVRVDFVHGWEQPCPGCSDGEHPDRVRAVQSVTCTADDSLIPQCNTTATAE